MSSVVIAGNTSGTVTLLAPDIAGTTTLTLPTTSGTIVTTAGGSTVPFALGSAASPSITFTGDTNTGIFSPGADTIGFAEGGAEVARFDSSGRLAIGTTSASSPLTVQGDSGGNGVSIIGRSGGQNEAWLFWYQNGGSTLNAGIIGDNQALKFATGSGNTERMRITSDGVTIAGGGIMYFGNSDQFVRGGGVSGTQLICGASAGGFYQQAGASYYLVTTSGGSTSDASLKTNVQQLNNSLDKVCAIRGVNFEFIDEQMCTADQGTQLGVIAQEVEAQFPEIVLTQENGIKTVRYDRLVAPLIEAIKEQQALITDLTTRLTALENK